MQLSLSPSFVLNFGHVVHPGRVCCGAFDGAGQGITLACGTAGGRVFLHRPSPAAAEEQGSAPIRFLSLNREVTALACGPLRGDRAVLLLGTAQHVQAYDVVDNRDVFFREAPDEVFTLLCGSWTAAAAPAAGSKGGAPSDGGSPIVFCGGNCSVQGLDAESGADAYWTVAGDEVTALCMGPCESQGEPRLLVGSKDFAIRVYEGEDMIGEVNETDAITALQMLPSVGAIVYALANGTVGVYSAASLTRVWRVKAPSRAVATALFDLDDDGAEEVVAGWASGRLEVRRPSNGELVYRETLPAPVASLQVCDYRSDGKPVLLVVLTNGEMRGYAKSNRATLQRLRALAAASMARNAPAAVAPAILEILESGGPASESGGVGAPAPAGVAAGVDALLQQRAQVEAQLRMRAALVPPAGGAGTAALPADTPPSELLVRFHACSGAPAAARQAEPQPSRRRLSSVGAPPPLLGAPPPGVTLSVSLPPGEPAGEAGSAPAQWVIRCVSVYSMDAGLFGPGVEAVTHVVEASRGGLAQHQAQQQSDAGMGAATSPGRVSIPLTLHRPMQASQLRVVAVIAPHPSAGRGLVLERQVRLPRFATLAPLPQPPPSPLTGAAEPPASCVRFSVKHDDAVLPAVRRWLQGSFPGDPSLGVEGAADGSGSATNGAGSPVVYQVSLSARGAGSALSSGAAVPVIEAHFVDLSPEGAAATVTPAGGGEAVSSLSGRSSRCTVRISVAPESAQHAATSTAPKRMGEAWLAVCIATADLTLAGMLVADLAAALGLSELSPTADYQDEAGAFRRVLSSLQSADSLRVKLAGDVAASCDVAKGWLIAAEDARVRGDLSALRRAYASLRGASSELVSEHTKRSANHALLVSSLKAVNTMIQKAANLRVGTSKTGCVAACREVLKLSSGGHAGLDETLIASLGISGTS